MKIKGYTAKKRQVPNGKLSIRWRKSSATYVIYVACRIFESGFASEKDAQDYLNDYCEVA